MCRVEGTLNKGDRFLDVLYSSRHNLNPRGAAVLQNTVDDINPALPM